MRHLPRAKELKMSDAILRRQYVGIVRDSNGKPKFDDPENAPAEMKAMLTDADIAHLSDDELRKLNLTHRRKGL